MRHAFVFLALALASSTSVLAQSSSPPPMNCDAGPVTKTFGSGPWLVYACDDGQSVVIVAVQSNPAFPFVFSFTPKAGSLRLYGEGTGSKQASAAAYAQLERFSASDIAALAAEARGAHAASQGKAPGAK
jgi:hypothetical protein